MTKTRKSLLDSFVPRHMRFGSGVFFDDQVHDVACHEIYESIPLLSESGSVVLERSAIVRVPAGEALKKYNVDDFKIKSLKESGVPLDEVTFNLNSRSQNDALIQKAISLGVLSEEFASQVVYPDVVVEPEKIE